MPNFSEKSLTICPICRNSIKPPKRRGGRNSGGGGFFSRSPSPGPPSEELFWGRRWGRGRFSKRSASSPDPHSRRVAGNRLVFSFKLVSPCGVGDFCGVSESTAADRAAADMRRGGVFSVMRGCGGGDFVPAGTRRWLSDRPRHPFGRSPAYRLVSRTIVGRSRRLCQPP